MEFSFNYHCQHWQWGEGFDERAVLDAVDPLKDVDAFTRKRWPADARQASFPSCTPHGIIQLLHRYKLTTSGKHVVVVGRSDIVGKPTAMMLRSVMGAVVGRLLTRPSPLLTVELQPSEIARPQIF